MFGARFQRLRPLAAKGDFPEGIDFGQRLGQSANRFTFTFNLNGAIGAVHRGLRVAVHLPDGADRGIQTTRTGVDFYFSHIFLLESLTDGLFLLDAPIAPYVTSAIDPPFLVVMFVIMVVVIVMMVMMVTVSRTTIQMMTILRLTDLLLITGH